jgi:hypothetical protein
MAIGLAVASLTVVVPLGLGIGIGWTGFDDVVRVDANAERIGVPPNLERNVYPARHRSIVSPRTSGLGSRSRSAPTMPGCGEELRLGCS